MALRTILSGACALLLCTGLAAEDKAPEPDWDAIATEVQTRPGDVGHALPRLLKLLEGPADHRDQALQQLVALARVGAIPRTYHRLIHELYDERHRRAEDKRWFEASLMRDAIVELAGANFRTDVIGWGLELRAGERGVAAAGFAPYEPRMGRFHIDATIAGHLRLFDDDRYMDRVIARLGAGAATVSDPAALVMDKDAAELAADLTATAMQGLPANDVLGTSINPWWHLRVGLPALGEDARAAVAERQIEPAAGGGEAGELLAWRQAPYGAKLRAALADRAWAHLTAGRRALAAACYRDLLATATATEEDLQARSGLALCLAGDPDRRAELASLLDAAPGPLPWKGGTVTASELAQELLTDIATGSPAGPGALDRAVLAAPAAAGWSPALFEDYNAPEEFADLLAPGVSLREIDGVILAAAPRMLLAYDAEQPGRPLWMQIAEGEWDAQRMGTPDRQFSALGPFAPAVVGGAIYTRWGPAAIDYAGRHPREQLRNRGNVRALRQQPVHVASFDLRDGAMRWSTAGRIDALEDLVPICDPVVDGDRVYVFCKDIERQSYRFSMLCLDAEDGSLLWLRELGHGGEASRDGKSRSRSVPWSDAAYAPAPTVIDGIAYWSPGGGLVLAIDLRDGLLLWRYDYAIDEATMRERGSSPLPVGDALVLATKDLRGAVALDRLTGAELWANPLVPAGQVVGRSGDQVVMRRGRRLTALDAGTGGVSWSWLAPGEVRGEVRQRGNDLVLAVDDALVAVDLLSGTQVDDAPFPGGSPEASFGIIGDRLLTIAPTIKAGRSSQPRDGLLARGTPRIRRGERFGVMISDGAIEAVDWAKGAVLWARQKPADLLDVRIQGDRILLIQATAVACLDASGTRVWQTDLGKARGATVENGYVVVTDTGGDDRVRVIRLDDGAVVAEFPRIYQDHWHDNTRTRELYIADGKLHRVVHTVRRKDKESWVQLVVDPLDGGEQRREKLVEWKGERWIRDEGRDGRHWWMVVNNGEIHHVDLAAGTHSAHGKLPWNREAERHASVNITVEGDLALIELPKDYSHSKQKNDVRRLHRVGTDEPLVEITENGRDLRLLDGATWEGSRGVLKRLNAKGEVAAELTIPASAEGHDYTPTSWQADGDGWLVLVRRQNLRFHRHNRWYYADRGPNDLDRFALDRYAADGSLRARLLLPQIRPTEWALGSDDREARPRVGHWRWDNEVLWDDAGLWITAPDGVHRVAFADIPERGRAGGNTLVLDRLDGRLAIDGKVGDWAAVSHERRERKGGTLMVSHDRSHLLIAVVQKPSAPMTMRGEGRFGGAGSWLQLNLAGNRFADDGGGGWEFDLGLDESGEVSLRRGAPPGTIAAVRYDHAEDSLVYELAVPVEPLRERKERLADQIDLAVTCYALTRPLQEWRHLSLRLHQYTEAQEDAGLTLTAAMPDLGESHSFLREILSVHIGDWPEGREFCLELLRSAPAKPLAAMTLLHLDEVLHGEAGDGREPAADLLALAADAGVAEPQLTLYRKLIGEKRRSYTDWAKAEWPGAEPLSPDQAQALLEQQVLALGRAPAAVDFLTALRRLRELDHEQGIELIRWFLERFGDHPQADELLEDWRSLAIHARNGDHDAGRVLMDQGLDAMGSSLPWRLVYDFRREKLYRDHDFIQDWNVVGPFPAAGLMEYDYGVPLPPRLARITLKERYRMPQATLSWQPLTCATPRVPISHWLGNPLEPSIAYCVAWVQSPDARQVAVELGADGPCRVWINRRYVHRRSSDRDQGPFHVNLAKGWNAILVEQAMAADGGWTFQLELVERMGKGVPDDLVVLETKGFKSIAEPVAVDPKELEPGLICEDFEGSWQKLPDFDSLEPREIKLARKIDLSVVERRDHIGLRFTGYIKIDELDFYTFSTVSDDGSQLFIGDQLVVNNDGLHGAEERFGTATLKPGYYPITITMFENEGGEFLEVFWRQHGDDDKRKLDEGDAIWCRP